MTVEERFERIEHITDGLAEGRRKDREEYRMMWRDTQRQIEELAVRITDLAGRMDQMVIDTTAAITRLAQETRAADEKLGQRIDSLVSAMGDFLRKQDSRM